MAGEKSMCIKIHQTTTAACIAYNHQSLAIVRVNRLRAYCEKKTESIPIKSWAHRFSLATLQQKSQASMNGSRVAGDEVTAWAIGTYNYDLLSMHLTTSMPVQVSYRLISAMIMMIMSFIEGISSEWPYILGTNALKNLLTHFLGMWLTEGSCGISCYIRGLSFRSSQRWTCGPPNLSFNSRYMDFKCHLSQCGFQVY